MKLFKPEVHLVRTVKTIGADEFHLHAVTYTDQANYRAAGYEVGTTLDEQGMLPVILFIEEDDSDFFFSFITPVVHTFTIGTLPFQEDDGLLNVTVVVNAQRDANDKRESHVSTTNAEEDDRPISPRQSLYDRG